MLIGEALEEQIRECFGRVAYSHKTHEKAADLCAKALSRAKWIQIVLSAVTTAGVVAVVFQPTSTAAKISAVLLSVLTLIVNAWLKDSNPGGSAQKHRDAAADLWNIREDYLSLLTDVRSIDLKVEDVIGRRDKLQSRTMGVYRKSPQTSSKAYMAAQKALKVDEELTFSSQEIDVMLPSPLRKTPCNQV